MSAVGEPARRVATLEAGEVAWVAVLPCGLLTLAAIVVLGPPLGHALLKPGPGEALWPGDAGYLAGHSEPVKHARFALALLGPALLALSALASRRRPLRMRASTVRGLRLASQLLVLALVVAAILGQNNVIFPVKPPLWTIFPAWALALALALPLALLAAARRAAVARWIARRVPDTRTRRLGCLAVAAVLTATWLLTAVNTEGTIGRAVFYDLPPWAMGDVLAILDGRTPLVNFYTLYGGVWAYVAAVPMYVLGPTIGVYTVTMTSISSLSLLAVFATFRRLLRSSLLALALYLPLLALGFRQLRATPGAHASNAQVFSVWPMRYAGPYLLLWLTARHIDGAAPRRVWPLMLVAGLVAINNLEFGAGALIATLVALLCAHPPESWPEIRRLAGGVAAGLLGALAIVALVTLVRSGALPDFAFLSEYPHIFGTIGYTNVPMPTAALHLVLYATYAAAIGAAAVRVANRDPDRLLTSLLAWSGIFGLLAGSYFAGRSDMPKLVALFSGWGLTLALLCVLVVRALAAREWRRPGLPELLVLATFGLAVGSVLQLPAPWSQISRLRLTTSPAIYAEDPYRQFVAAHTRPGEHVVILMPMGHRLARQLGLVDVSPYAFIETLATKEQWRKLIAASRREHAHVVFAPIPQIAPSQRRLLARAGYPLRARGASALEMSDAR